MVTRLYILTILFWAITMLGGLASPLRAQVDVTISGAEFFGVGKLKNTLPEEPESPSRGQVISWKGYAGSVIERLYRERGFLAVRVQSTITRDPGEEGGASVQFTILEGDRFVFDTVYVRTTDNSRPLVTAEDLRAGEGRPLTTDLLLRDKRDIARTYGNAGFLRASVEDSLVISQDTSIVTAFYTINPSYPVILDTLIVETNRVGAEDSLSGITSMELLRSLVPYEQGDTISEKQNDQLVEKLLATGVYTTVRLRDSLVDTAAMGSVLHIAAVEQVPGYVGGSVFYETEYGLGGSFTIRHANVLGRYHQLRFNSSIAFNKQSFSAGYGTPLLFGMLLRFDNDLEFDWYQISEIHEQRNTPPFEGDFEGSNTTKLSRSFADWLRMVSSAELLAKRRLVSPEDEQDESNAQPLPHVDGVAVDKGLNLNFITTGFSSFLDARVNPRRGARWALTWGNGGPLGFSGIQPQLAARHNWIELQSAYYYPLLKPLISAARLDGGRFFGTGGINSDRFFLGGPRNVRAFGFRELCPSEEFGQVCSGEDLVPAYYLASLEFRFTPLGFRQISEESPLSWFQPVQLVPFVDYGKVWNLREPFGQQPHGQGTAYGLGFRYPVFDIFQVRLDFAWGVTGAGNEAFAWIIDLAQAF